MPTRSNVAKYARLVAEHSEKSKQQKLIFK